MTQKTSLQQNYSLRVTEASDDYTHEWIGKVRLMPQENGDIYLSITFSCDAEINPDSTRQPAIGSYGLSIDPIG